MFQSKTVLLRLVRDLDLKKSVFYIGDELGLESASDK